MHSASNEFKAFETDLDTKIDKLSFWDLPFQTIMLCYLVAADSMIVGGRFGRKQPIEQFKAERLLARLSYLAPLLKICPNPEVRNAKQALKNFKRDHVDDAKLAIAYAHFCEIMPHYHKGYYNVSKSSKAFTLGHTSAKFSECEVKDIILTELSLGFDTSSPKKLSLSHIASIASSLPNKNKAKFLIATKENYEHYVTCFNEPSFLPDEAYPEFFGFSQTAFIRTRAALWAFSEVLLLLSRYTEEMANTETDVKKQAKWQWQTQDLISPTFKKRWLIDLLRSVTSLEKGEVEGVITFLCADIFKNDFSKFSEGFVPPIMDLGVDYLAPPLLLRMMPSMRNLVYLANRINPDGFNNHLSKFLEPSLLSEMEDCLEKTEDIQVEKNVKWSSGEVDAILGSRDGTAFVLIQAKAAIPPEGARMTRNLEARTIEAISQFDAFDQLSTQTKRTILETRFEYVAEEFTIQSAMLTRSGLGTQKAWDALDGKAVLNIGILRELLTLSELNASDFLRELPICSSRILQDLTDKCFKGWNVDSISLIGESVTLPSLDLNYDMIWSERSRIFNG